jgi:alpha-1,3-mannosyltransferase
MVPEETFLDKRFAAALLAAHALVLTAFAHHRWLRPRGGAAQAAWRFLCGQQPRASLEPHNVLRIVLTSNFVGIVTARSLHYQFYSWYFHSLPLMLWLTGHPAVMALVTLLVVELCWNVYPSTKASSSVLLVHHLGLLHSLWASDAACTKVD